MPRESSDRDSTWFLTGDNQTWTLTVNATIDALSDTYGIEDQAAGSDIHVLGSVKGRTSGVAMGNAATLLDVGLAGLVFGEASGVHMHPDGGLIRNRGIIQSYETGIEGGYGVIENMGLIEGDTGIELEDGAFIIENAGFIRGWDNGVIASGRGTITNLEGARIDGSDYGLSLYGSGPYEIVNEGVISGDDAAIYAEGSVTLKNTGIIIGDILLGGSADRIDTRGGIVRGAIHGGEGDDLYLISSTDTRIIDNGASFQDVVRSTATYVLTGGLDDLKLLGRKNVDGTGNVGANEIAGNAGRNRLDGGAGEDFLSGGAGKDILTGGADADLFAFHRGFDIDRITDFADGLDRLDSELVTTQAQFNHLDIRQAGDDTVIDFGRGDRLILEGISKSAIDFSDFMPV